MTAKEMRANLVRHIQNRSRGFAMVRLRQYEEQLCKEQREICRDEIAEETNKRDINLVAAIKEIVLNAPKPDL